MSKEAPRTELAELRAELANSNKRISSLNEYVEMLTELVRSHEDQLAALYKHVGLHERWGPPNPILGLYDDPDDAPPQQDYDGKDTGG